MPGQGFPEIVLHAPRTGDAAGEEDIGRADPGLDQDHDILAHGVEEAGQDSGAVLALVGQMGHVGF